MMRLYVTALMGLMALAAPSAQAMFDNGEERWAYGWADKGLSKDMPTRVVAVKPASNKPDEKLQYVQYEKGGPWCLHPKALTVLQTSAGGSASEAPVSQE